MLVRILLPKPGALAFRPASSVAPLKGGGQRTQLKRRARVSLPSVGRRSPGKGLTRRGAEGEGREGRAHTSPGDLGRRRGPGGAEAGAGRLAASASANSSALPARIGAAASR